MREREKEGENGRKREEGKREREGGGCIYDCGFHSNLPHCDTTINTHAHTSVHSLLNSEIVLDTLKAYSCDTLHYKIHRLVSLIVVTLR